MRKIDHFFRHDSKYLKLRKPLEAAHVCDVARKVAHGRFEVISFKQGLLTLALITSAEAANLQLEIQGVINEINDKIGEKLVLNIRYKIK